jgi:hypothetical protein
MQHAAQADLVFAHDKTKGFCSASSVNFQSNCAEYLDTGEDNKAHSDEVQPDSTLFLRPVPTMFRMHQIILIFWFRKKFLDLNIEFNRS